MKRLYVNSIEQGQAEEIVITDNAIIGYNGGTEIFALRGVKFKNITYEIQDENGNIVTPPVYDLQLNVDSQQINAGDTITVIVNSVPALDLIIDLLIDGPPVEELQLTNGQGQDTFTLVDPGKYLIEAIYGDIRKYLFVEAI